MESRFLLRKSDGDQAVQSESDLRTLFERGQCRVADFVFDFSSSRWTRLGEHPSLQAFFSGKPMQAPERKVIYYVAPGAGPRGPLSPREIQACAQSREICASTWVFVEGDKEWRQVRNVKVLHEMLPALPAEAPPSPVAAPSAPAAEAPRREESAAVSSPVLQLSPGPGDPGPGRAPEPDPKPALNLEASEAVPVPELKSAPPAAPESPPPFAPPVFKPAPAVAAGKSGAALEPEQEAPSISLDLSAMQEGEGTAPAGAPAAPERADEAHVEREEITMALDVMGLKLHSQNLTPPAAPPGAPAAGRRPGLTPLPPATAAHQPPARPPQAPPVASLASAEPSQLSIESNPAIRKPASKESADGFDGIVAEIPVEPIWLVKQANSESSSGPFRFLELIRFLEEGRLTRNDKVARVGTKAFVKIAQQYEFNVKFSVETVMEGGQERQKILIRRRHPRVPYMTGVQIVSKHGLLAGQCMNISAGGILMEAPKAEFNLGEIIEVKILPGLISKAISCKSLIIGKIPKIPPGYALKFEDLKAEDKEAIEYFVQETLKREMQKKT